MYCLLQHLVFCGYTTSIYVMQLQKQLKKIVSIEESDIEGVLHLADEQDVHTDIKGCFYLIECTHDKVREEDLLTVIEDLVIRYCLQYAEQESINKTNALALTKKAVRKFVSSSQSGELGEIILFCLLEAKLNAVQLLNKMQLKTHPNMHYHGADAVHFGVDGVLKTLYLGEAKMQASFGAALRGAFNSVNALFDDMGSRKEFEVDLIQANLDHDKLQGIEKEILNYLDPYKQKRDFCETIAIFVGYSWEELNEVKGKEIKGGLMPYLIKKYKEEVVGLIKAINKKVSKQENLQSKRFVFFVIPFSNVQHIKNRFTEKLKQW